MGEREGEKGREKEREREGERERGRGVKRMYISVIVISIGIPRDSCVDRVCRKNNRNKKMTHIHNMGWKPR